MAIVLIYDDRHGIVKERFIGVVHVLDTSCLTLKAAIDTIFSNNNLTIDQMRGQGYDGASNMSGEFNGLKSLILNENSSTHYIHCFAHQLQLVVLAVAKKHDDVEEFFEQLDMTREMQKERVAAEIGIGETERRRGLNQEISLVRARDTRWGSHFRTIEFGERFNEVGTELMENMAALSPCDSFSSFDKAKLLLKLTLILPDATATVERCISAMKFLKTDLRNRIGDDFKNDDLICSVEKEALENVKTKYRKDASQKETQQEEQRSSAATTSSVRSCHVLGSSYSRCGCRDVAD
ncbi:uncharacterized protein LOC111898012 [Lactuca sativa]|uniref:uncharacterized protein LOC111898012 n=1 Tax=Lactuca sativa TaxID=4236 RepID=UPI0022AECC6D|nr:uncharacterized protein LOC111898012 [Lactuca sativa]